MSKGKIFGDMLEVKKRKEEAESFRVICRYMRAGPLMLCGWFNSADDGSQTTGLNTYKLEIKLMNSSHEIFYPILKNMPSK